jgi:hypothetical protein
MTLKDLHDAMLDDRAHGVIQEHVVRDYVDAVNRLVQTIEKWRDTPGVDDSDEATRLDLEFLDELMLEYRRGERG